MVDLVSVVIPLGHVASVEKTDSNMNTRYVRYAGSDFYPDSDIPTLLFP